jgi:hypothetical protein
MGARVCHAQIELSLDAKLKGNEYRNERRVEILKKFGLHCIIATFALPLWGFRR